MRDYKLINHNNTALVARTYNCEGFDQLTRLIRDHQELEPTKITFCKLEGGRTMFGEPHYRVTIWFYADVPFSTTQALSESLSEGKDAA